MIIDVGHTLTVLVISARLITSTLQFQYTGRNGHNAMAFIPVPATAQLEITSMMSSQRTQWVLHYQKATPSTYNAADLEDLVDACVVHLNQTSVKAMWPTTQSIVAVRAIDLSTQFGPAFDADAGLPILGTRAGAQLPNNCALVLTKRTGLRGRSFRGRLYFGALTESDVIQNTVDSAFQTSVIGNLANGFTSYVGAATTHNLVVVSRFTNNAPRVSGIVTNVVGWTTDGTIDSQRRRLPGRGS